MMRVRFRALVPVSQASLCDLEKVWDLSEPVGWSFVCGRGFVCA